MTSGFGAGSLRQRRPGVWEIRVAVGRDAETGRSVQRSVTVHGDRAAAVLAQRQLATSAALARSRRRPASTVTLGELLQLWLDADLPWRPSTAVGYRSIVEFLCTDRLGRLRASAVGSEAVRAACSRWLSVGTGEPTVWARVRALRSALRWAVGEGILLADPLAGMHGPPQPATRRQVPPEQVRELICFIEHRVAEDRAHPPEGVHGRERLHRDEQLLLLVRLAADTGARRGELAALRFADLSPDGVLTIARSASANIVGPTKNGRVRQLTLGERPARLWRELESTWRERCAPAPLGPRLFSTQPTHRVRLCVDALAHWFAELCAEAGMPEVTLHRLRHTLATFLVGGGDVLGAQYRLGHADAYTTLRIYSHAQPLADQRVAALVNDLYATPEPPPTVLDDDEETMS